jgi:hypothetical protein
VVRKISVQKSLKKNPFIMTNNTVKGENYKIVTPEFRTRQTIGGGASRYKANITDRMIKVWNMIKRIFSNDKDNDPYGSNPYAVL